MILFLKFLLAHLLGDFVFQSEKWVKNKEKYKIKSKKLYLHIGIHALLLLIILQFNVTYWLGILCIIISHFGIDLAKIYLQKPKNKRVLFFIDQLLHIIMLVAVVYMYTPFSFTYSHFLTEKNLLFLCCLFFVTSVSAVLIRIIITQWNPQSKNNETNNSLEKAGKFIGILERTFVFIFVITNHWEAIGFLLAAKSVFRFSDLKDRKITEYILIGTLLSFGLAIFTGFLYIFLIQFNG